MIKGHSVWQNCLAILTFCALSTAAQNTVPTSTQPDLPPACRQPDQRDRCIEELVDIMLAERKKNIDNLLSQKNNRSATSPSCTCPDGRTFTVGDKVLFNDSSDNDMMKPATLVSQDGCYNGTYEFPRYVTGAFGRTKKDRVNRWGTSDSICDELSKPLPQTKGSAASACTCPDGRTFASGDTIIVHYVPLFSTSVIITTGKLTQMNGCGSVSFKYMEYLPSMSGKIHKLKKAVFTDHICEFSKPEPRRSIVKALSADPSLLKDAPSYEIPEESKDSGSEESTQRRPPESGNLLEGMKTGEETQLPGGFKAGDYVFVPKDAHIKGQKIPRETMGIVLGSAGKNSDKLRVKFLVHKTGRAILDFAVGIYIPWTLMNPYQEVIVPIDPADVWGINMPRIF